MSDKRITVTTNSGARYQVTGKPTNAGGTVTLTIDTLMSGSGLSDGYASTYTNITMTRREAEELRNAIEDVCDRLAEVAAAQQ